MLSCQKNKFYLTDKVTYLNCAYMAPTLKSTHDVGIEGLAQKCFPFEVKANDFFENPKKLRTAFAKLINAQDPNRIAIIPSVSYAMANVANNIPLEKNDTIIVLADQFPSNYYIWQRRASETGATIVTVSPPNTNENRGKIWNQRILEAIDHNTKVVTMAHVHWADGTRFDLEAIRKRASEVGAALVLDATQSVGALPFDAAKVQPDALICAGYKWLMGPYSIGLAYYGEYFDNGTPIEENWINRLNSYDFKNLVNYQSAYEPMAQRYSVGEQSNFILVPMMLDSINQILEWTPEAINEYCLHISQKAWRILKNLDCWIEDMPYVSPHLLGVRLSKKFNMEAIQQELQYNNIHVSYRGDSIRISSNVYNDKNDFEKLIACFRSPRVIV